LAEEIVIEAGRIERQYWRDIWRYRELFFFLTWRDILVRYKQTVIGIAWSVIRPFMTMVVFTVVFGKLAKLPSESGAPYPILVFAALLPWQAFSNGLNESSQSIVANANMLSKVYFPRLIIPGSAIVVSLIDFLISCAILVLLMLWYGFLPNWQIVAIPVFLMIGMMAAFGCGLLFSALNVRYRDFRYIVPFMVQIGLYVSPVGFSSSIIPDQWRLFYSLNPMVGVIDGFRWAILGGAEPLYLPGLILSIVVSAALVFAGFFYFRKTEKTFADVI
jgi:lipopolysaccharide transport system permease protein